MEKQRGIDIHIYIYKPTDKLHTINGYTYIYNIIPLNFIHSLHILCLFAFTMIYHYSTS